MLTKEQNEQLTKVGPGTPMGELFRRYWHPVAAVSQMKERNTFPVRILGENLVLSEINSRDEIYKSIKDFLGKGK
jgi:5,5'-dehydrodivanillate O-demethylase